MRRTAKLRAGKFIVESLRAEGVKYLFGIPGGGIAPFYNEFFDYPEIKTILTQHEQGAGFMADGYFRACDQVSAESQATLGNPREAGFLRLLDRAKV